FFAVDVLVVGQQVKVEIQRAVAWTDRNAADRGDAIPAIPGIQNRCLTAGSPGPADDGIQHEARFIEKNQVRITLLRFAGNARKLPHLPIEDCRLIAPTRATLRLLRRPAQPLPQESAHMIVVIADAELPKDDLADACGRPERIGPTVRLGTLK